MTDEPTITVSGPFTPDQPKGRILVRGTQTIYPPLEGDETPAVQTVHFSFDFLIGADEGPYVIDCHPAGEQRGSDNSGR